MNPYANVVTNTTGTYMGYLRIDSTFPNLTPRPPEPKSSIDSRHLLVEQKLPTGAFQWFTDSPGTSRLFYLLVSGCKPSLLLSPWGEWSRVLWNSTRGIANWGAGWSTLTPEVVLAGTIAPPALSSPVLDWCSSSGSANVQATENATSLAEGKEQLLDRTTTFLETLVDEYVAGIIDIPDITRQLGEAWTEGQVVELLEQLGAYRPISAIILSSEERQSILADLAKIRGTAQAERLINDPKSIDREVVASSRIESVRVLPQDLTSD